ncbi:hypothetical protein [Streptomyces sp. KL116D]|uniref:hypothetical protein n=1 Tax=Streptomyces sp. KL116D TaxID=3045152 RepID=UPI0035567C16
MALIENSIGELPTSCWISDQHSSRAADDCFTRFMRPGIASVTAVRPIMAADGKRKILLANDRIVTALENDLDQAVCARPAGRDAEARVPPGERPRAVL